MKRTYLKYVKLFVFCTYSVNLKKMSSRNRRIRVNIDSTDSLNSSHIISN